MRKKHGLEIALDADLLALLRAQILEGLDINIFLEKLRPPARIVEVPVVVDTPVYATKTF